MKHVALLSVLYFGSLYSTLSPDSISSAPIHHRKKTHRLYAWKSRRQKISKPPATMGKQMGVIETPGVPPLGYELEGKTKVFHLIAQPVIHTIVDGNNPAFADIIPAMNQYHGSMHYHPIQKTIYCWGYNGSMPGPTIEVTQGDHVKIQVTNELPEPTSIHWHGLEIPNDQDGAAGETEPPIMPGGKRIYEFTLYQSGTFMYHSGFNMMKQDHMGLSGMFIVHPKQYEKKPTKQFAILLQEWAILPGNQTLNLTTMDFNWFTFNGLSAPSIPALSVAQGDKVRIRFANMIMNSHPIHLHGYSWEEVGTEGGAIPKTARKLGATIEVAPGSTRDVAFTAWNPGLWRLHCHKLHHVINAHANVPMGVMPHGGMFTLLNVVPKDPDAPWRHPNEATNDT